MLAIFSNIWFKMACYIFICDDWKKVLRGTKTLIVRQANDDWLVKIFRTVIKLVLCNLLGLNLAQMAPKL